MVANNEPKFLVISGVGLLGKSYKCQGKEELFLYISENFSESSGPLRIVAEHSQENNEFICFISNEKMTVCTDSLGKRVVLTEKPIKEAIAIISFSSEKEEIKPKFETFKLIAGFMIFLVLFLIMIDRFAPQLTEATQTRRDCLANAALLALKNDDADGGVGDYSHRCY